MTERPKSDRFFVKSAGALRLLDKWLADREFNSLYHGARDQQGNQLIGLSWTSPSGQREDRGLVVVPAAELLAPTLALLQQHQAGRAAFGLENLYVTLPGTVRQSLAKLDAMLVCGPAGWLVATARPDEVSRIVGHSGDPKRPMRLELESLMLCDTLGQEGNEKDGE